VRRDPAALQQARRHFRTAIRNAKILQWIFDSQWHRLRAYSRDRGIKIIGDIPIFVAHDSADAWAHPELFYINDQGKCTVVAGVPPDYFSATGQLWGNPLYRWDVHRQQDYTWWAARLRKIFEMVGHCAHRPFPRVSPVIGKFRAMPRPPSTASGCPVPSPRSVPRPEADISAKMNIIAEDLGVITPDVDMPA
jgi:4-alpha-glucanotransferase